jgi:uncharacterized protein
MATFGEFGALTGTVVVRGLVIGAALMIGPFLARGMVRHVRPHSYALLIDLVLLTAAGGMFVAVWTQ